MPDYGKPFDKTSRTLDSLLNNKAGQALGKISNPVLRDAASGLLDAVLPGFGGGSADLTDNAFIGLVNKRLNRSYTEQVQLINTAAPAPDSNLKESYDWRARLRPKEGGKNKFYGLETPGMDAEQDFLMKPIYESNGLVWQYTPQVYLQTSVDYNAASFQGSNYPINTFSQGRVGEISVSAEFTANNQYEARYMLAVQMFLKVASKAHFGDSSVANNDYGIPPPVLLFEYLGEYGFNKVPVVVSNYTIEYGRDVDYVPVIIQGNDGPRTTYVPTKTNITVTLTPQYTPHKLRKRFDIESIANGTSYKDGFI